MSDPAPKEFVDKWTKVIGAPVRANNKVDWLIDAWGAYAAMNKAIETTFKGDASNYYIYLLGWWMDEGVLLDQNNEDTAVMKLFQKAADKGVQIRVMLFDNVLKDVYVVFYRAGMLPKTQIATINKMPGAEAILDGTKPTHTFQGHHQKLLLVRGSEGLVGFCGGLDLSFDRVKPVKRHTGSPFHDVHCRIEGPSAKDMVGAFVQRWSAHPAGAKTKDKLRCLSDMPPVRGGGDDKGPGEARVGIIRTFVRAEGCIEEQSCASTVLAAIAASKRFIYAEDQYMISMDVAAAIGKALSHLQFCFILVPHSNISDLPLTWATRAKFIDTVFKNCKKSDTNKFHIFYKLGSRDYGLPKRKELQETPDDPPGLLQIPQSGDFPPHTYIHAKIWVFDDEMAIIGSANINRRGLYFDSELGAAIFDMPPTSSRASFAQQLRMNLWAEHLGLSPEQMRFVPRSVQLMWWKYPQYIRHYSEDEKSDEDPSVATGISKDLWGWVVDPVDPTNMKKCSQK